MCGIVGYTGKNDCVDLLIDGLSKLEYRGYDSAGIAVMCDGQIEVKKSKGRLADLEKKMGEEGKPHGTCGIGHTRWATHGEPSDINSHPHGNKRVSIVHNGIIENYLELKEKYHPNPVSQTDTEIAAAVINACYHGNPTEAIFQATAMFHGAYALCIMFDDIPDTVFAIRQSSPLIVAVGQNECFLASDVPAILAYTKNYYLPEKGELAVLNKDGVRFVTADGKPVEKELKTADWDESAAQKKLSDAGLVVTIKTVDSDQPEHLL